ncbi:hypothetical protein PO124_20915 [Bacillus licheniformis]|nr:hypothetical protein [Bacillus licheniformis]
MIGTGLGMFTKPAADNISLGLDLQGGLRFCMKSSLPNRATN